jgi:copper homeostasis protein
MDQNKILVDLAKPLACTFHRAFDEVLDAFQALEQIIDCGFRTILTSGQAQNATQGLHRLTELAAKATNRICIMPGGSLRSSNIGIVRQQTKADWFHSSAITDDTIIADPNEIIALKSNLR